MGNKIKEIAQRLKELREIEEVSIEEMAAALAVDQQVYASYETGTVDIPISVLYSASAKLNVELTVLLTGDEPKLSIYSLTRNGEGIEVERRKEYKYKDLAYNFKHKKAELFMVTVEPKNLRKPSKCYAHNGHEVMYVTEGKILLAIKEREVVLEKGDLIYFDSSYEHAMLALEGKEAKFLSIVFN